MQVDSSHRSLNGASLHLLRPLAVERRWALALACLVCFLSAAGLRGGPLDEPALHDAPRAPTPEVDPNPPKGPADEAFLRLLIMNRAEGNSGGRTTLIEIHKFTMAAPRQAAPNETQPRASDSPVTPIEVEWKSTSYGQGDTATQEHRQQWICWKNERPTADA